MNREILFRGKAGDEWVYGDLGRLKNAITITKRNFIYPYIVMPETVGQFTGLTDKNGVKIFEGDILKYRNVLNKPHVGTVKYYANAKPVADNGYYIVDLAECNPDDFEIIGNIFDNPELLKGEENE